MRYVLVISPQPLDIDPDADARSEGGVWFEAMGPGILDWDDEAEKFTRLEAMGPDRVVYAVHWNDLVVLRKTLGRMIARDDVILDDDYELFVTGSEFVEMSSRNPGNRWWLGGNYD